MGNVAGAGGGGFTVMVNGVDLRAQHLMKFDEGVVPQQTTAAATNNKGDEIMLFDPETRSTYVAYGEGMDFEALDGYMAGDQLFVTLTSSELGMQGKRLAVMPFVKEVNGQQAQFLFDDEINTGTEGLMSAVGTGQTIGLGVGKAIGSNAMEVIGGVSTASYLAVAGGATKAAVARTVANPNSVSVIAQKLIAERGMSAAAANRAANSILAQVASTGSTKFGTAASTQAAKAAIGAANQGLGVRAANFFVPAQTGQQLLGQAGKGVKNWGPKIAIAAGVAAAAYGGYKVYQGASADSNFNALESLGTKIH